MSAVKECLRVAKISNADASRYLEKNHPLGAGNHAVKFALGIFWNGRFEGVMTWGIPVSSSAVLIYNIRLCDCLELRKMFVSDVPPKNSESRALGVAVRMIRKTYPQLKALITYCDSEEAASSYRGIGWIPQESHCYINEIKHGGKWYTVRDANRHGFANTNAEETKSANRMKYILPLDEAVRQIAESKRQRSAGKGEERSTTGISIEKMPSTALDRDRLDCPEAPQYPGEIPGGPAATGRRFVPDDERTTIDQIHQGQGNPGRIAAMTLSRGTNQERPPVLCGPGADLDRFFPAGNHTCPRLTDGNRLHNTPILAH